VKNLTPEQYQDRYMRTCVRCGRWRFAGARFPDGPVCTTCLKHALRTRGPCPGCGQERTLMGRLDGAAACRDCAGITREFSCRHCDYPGEDCRGRQCARCALTARLAVLLTGPDGTPSKVLQPLASRLRDGPDPARALTWITKPHVRALLADLASGRTGLSHQGLAALPARRAATYMRDLLTDCGVLPPADRLLMDYEGWLGRQLTALDGTPHQRLLRESGTWHQLPRLRAAAARGPLRPTSRTYAEHEFRAAMVFLTWLAARGCNPAATTQADIDTFYLTHKVHQRQAVRGFLTWATRNRRMPALDIPVIRYARGDAITQQQRLDLLRDLATSKAALASRAAGCLMLLYAQPLSRFIRLTASDVEHDGDGQVRLLLGDPPAPVPEPFSAMLTELADSQPPGGWLFPGGNAGQPVACRTMLGHLRGLGLPMRAGRIAAVRQLVTPGPRARHRRRSRIPPDHHYPPGLCRRRDLEPVRRHPQPLNPQHAPHISARRPAPEVITPP
jgi:hypothetical protein